MNPTCIHCGANHINVIIYNCSGKLFCQSCFKEQSTTEGKKWQEEYDRNHRAEIDSSHRGECDSQGIGYFA